ncbi:MAG TPA: vanadium-dependent haloperoxidase, partial [Gaiellaceae bacterium]|nr:vanadium-dependent haloperoxidase [Gaiellaceae bacterium]
RADAVTEWNVNATTLIFGLGQGPQISVPHLAIVHGAVYDAVNAIDRTREGYLLTSPVGTPFDSKEAAAATAAYRVLASLYTTPAQQATLATQYAASLGAISDGPAAKAGGIAVGEAAAAAMIAARTNDGRFGPYRFPVGTLPGEWRPVLPLFVNDPNAWLKDVKPFLVEDPARFMSKGPNELTSNQYAREFNEVKAYGSLASTARSDDQTHMARYWAENPPATWSRVLRRLSAQQAVSLVDNARLFAMAYMSASDALITVWNDKAKWPFWRPITAIREADTDGNAGTDADPNWVPLIPSPPYTEHSSGHGGLSSAMVRTLQQFFGTDEIGWTDTNGGGLTRSFTRLSQAIDEVVDARVWSGIHFRTADEAGAQIGKQIAQYAHARYFKPVG